jgi:Fic family protein
MTKRDNFIQLVNILLATADSELVLKYQDGMKFFQEFQEKYSQPGKTTEIGGKVLAYMKEQLLQGNDVLTANQIGTGLQVSSRSASGAMKKLITDNFVERVSKNPTMYRLIINKENLDNESKE